MSALNGQTSKVYEFKEYNLQLVIVCNSTQEGSCSYPKVSEISGNIRQVENIFSTTAGEWEVILYKTPGNSNMDILYLVKLNKDNGAQLSATKRIETSVKNILTKLMANE